MQIVKTFLKKKSVLLLLCIAAPCLILIRCTHDKLKDEVEKESSHIRIGTYKTLIQACKEHTVLEGSNVSFELEKITYKEIEEEYENFHDQYSEENSDPPIVKLRKKLEDDGYVLDNLKKVEQGLLEYLQTPPKPK